MKTSVKNRLIPPVKAKKQPIQDYCYCVVEEEKEYCLHGDPDRYYFRSCADAWNYYHYMVATGRPAVIQRFQLSDNNYWQYQRTVMRTGGFF